MRSTMSEQIELSVRVHQEDGMYWAEVPTHPGLFASGETMDELLEAVGEAWHLYTHDDKVAQPVTPPATRLLQVLVPA
jgi:predicted RNase H-like HicB family nuclease